jgi:dihydropteroate synthase
MQAKLYLRPIGLAPAAGADGAALPLAGGWTSFFAYDVAVREGSGVAARASITVDAAAGWVRRNEPRLADQAELWRVRLCSPRAPWAGLPMDKPHVMAVINVTPDSFSDGGDRFDVGKAIEDGLAMMEAGASLIDVGGESTRPGSDPLSVDEELRRVIPVVEALAKAGALLSIDTRRARAMQAALDAGAQVVNDITALTGDPSSLKVVADSKVPVVLMHMQGEPRTMQINPAYDDVALDIYDVLEQRIAACEQAGIRHERIAIDPGIGFGKTVGHNLELLDKLAIYHGLGCAIVLGASRKSFIGRLSRGEPPKQRVPGSLAAAIAGLERGVQIVRVHDVAETMQAIAVWHAIARETREAAFPAAQVQP